MAAKASPREWDAVGYDSIVLPHEQWGQWVVDGLALRDDAHVVDLGAGTGRDTAELLDRLPRGRVTAVDGSTAMLARLRTRLPDVDAARLVIVRADLAGPISVSGPADAVISVATLHWLAAHGPVFRRVHDMLWPGGVFRAEWGGAGNVANLDRILAEIGVPRLAGIAHYATVEDTAARLRLAGFREVEVEAVPGVAAVPDDAEERETLLRAVILGPVLDRLPPDCHQAVVDAVVARLAGHGVDYVRLHVTARRPA